MSHITPKKVKEGIVRLTKLPGNDMCADCKVANPKWASVNLGIFLCVQCAGIHRELGVHITQVRSLSLDTWKVEWYRTIKHRGNTKAAAFWEPGLKDSDRPTATLGMDVRKKFIRDKYQHGLYKQGATRVSRGRPRRSPKSATQRALTNPRARRIRRPASKPNNQPNNTRAAPPPPAAASPASDFSFIDADSGKTMDDDGLGSSFSFIEAPSPVRSATASQPLFGDSPMLPKPAVPTPIAASVNNSMWLDQMTSGGYPKTKHHIPLNSPRETLERDIFSDSYTSLDSPTLLAETSPKSANVNAVNADLFDLSGLGVSVASPAPAPAVGNDFDFLSTPVSVLGMDVLQPQTKGGMVKAMPKVSAASSPADPFADLFQY